jgi:hypothetical protein
MRPDPMITDLELGRLVSETKHSLTRNGPRYEGSTGRLMELSETHVIVISSEEINNVQLFGSIRDLRGFSEHPRFRGYFQAIPCFEKNDPMSWAYICPEIFMDMEKLERKERQNGKRS